MRHGLPRVPKVLHLELAKLLTPQGMKQQRRKDRAVALAADTVVRLRQAALTKILRMVSVGRIEQLARLMIAESRGFPFTAFRFRPRDAFDRVMRDGVLVAEIFKQRCQSRKPVPADPTSGPNFMSAPA